MRSAPRAAVIVDAVEIAAATSGHAVVVSGSAVIISMAGLFLARDAVFSSFAVGSILVVAVAVVGSLTVLPALLAKLGRWVDRPRIPLVWRLTAHSTADGQPAAAVLAGRAAAGARAPDRRRCSSLSPRCLRVASPALGMQLKFPGTEDLPADDVGDAGVRPADRSVPEYGHQSRGRRTGARRPGRRRSRPRWLIWSQRTKDDQLFASDGLEPSRVSPRTARSRRSRSPRRTRAGSQQARDSLTKLRKELMPETVGKVPGVEYAVGGCVAADVDYAAHIAGQAAAGDRASCCC